MNLVSEISNELAIAILVEKRHRDSLQQFSPKDLIERISVTLEDRRSRINSSQTNEVALEESFKVDSMKTL